MYFPKSLIIASMALALCACTKDGDSSPSSPAAPAEGPATKTVEFPRTFSGTLRLQTTDTAEFVSSSSYSKDNADSLLGCSETADGRDFTFTLKNAGSYPDELKITAKNIFVRDNKETYKDLSDVTLDGFTRNNWYKYDSSKQAYQMHHCEGKFERVKNFVSGFFQCLYTVPLNTARQVDFVLNFKCDIVQK